MNPGAHVFRFRWLILAGWLAAAGLAFAVPSADPAATERATFLPDYAPYVQAIQALIESFPDGSSLSEAVVVFERPAGALRQEDFDFIEHVAARIAQADTGKVSSQELAGVKVRSPRSLSAPKLPLLDAPAIRNPMVSEVSARGQAALVRVNVPYNFLALRSARVVNHIRAMLAAEKPPQGLSSAISGSCGFGHDYARAADRSYERASYVTLSAVIIILLLVYRAPLAAMIPLGAISLAAVVVLAILGIGQFLHMHVGTAERIFVFVLLYGAGTDYSLLLISRYREFLRARCSPPDAAAGALTASFPTILASAMTNAAGLFMMTFADFGIFQTTGPAVAIAVVVALLATVTLVPALIGIFGPRQFWPGKREKGTNYESPTAAGESSEPGKPAVGPLLPAPARGFWPALARIVTVKPALILIVTLGALAVPAWRGVGLTWVYDTLAGTSASYESGVGNAAAGVEIAKRHWPIGEIAPVTVLARAGGPLPADQWEEFSRALAANMMKIPGVREVRSLDQPLGAGAPMPDSPLLRPIIRRMAQAEYLSADGRAMRMSVVLGSPPFSLEAMAAVREVRRASEQAAQSGRQMQVLIAGATAEMTDVRAVTQHDFYRIAALTLGAIFVIVLILLRDVILTAFMVASTLLSYLATLGLTYWFFAYLLGAEGLDWKVEVFLFVVMVAVGVDYSIFLAARVKQEARKLPMIAATQQAIIHTGPVISSCGVIMAATLGSVMAGDLKLMLQLGFAFALGMLIDTFVIRPLLLPAFAVLVRPRRGSDAIDSPGK